MEKQPIPNDYPSCPNADMVEIYYANGEQKWIKASEFQFDLENLQKIVEGYIEIIRIPPNTSEGYALICNEEGLLQNLPLNEAGSWRFREICLRNQINLSNLNQSSFVGSLVICKFKYLK